MVEYTLKDAEGYGRIIFKTRLIEVANGKVKHTGEVTLRSTGEMKTNGFVKMHSKTVKPAIDKVAATLLELKL